MQRDRKSGCVCDDAHHHSGSGGVALLCSSALPYWPRGEGGERGQNHIVNERERGISPERREREGHTIGQGGGED